MNLRLWSSFAAALLVVFGGLSASAGPAVTPSKEAPRFEKLKALVGRWETSDADKDGKPDQVAVYRLTGAGTAVQETLFPDTPKEMVTLYTLDGDDLVLTHYCSLGNQPHMKAEADAAAGSKIAFAYVSGGNLKSRDAIHMDALALTLTDATHLRHDWTLWQDGKAVQTVSFEFTKKS